MALVVVVTRSGDSTEEVVRPEAAATGTGTGTKTSTATRRRSSKRRTYTVRPGDTPSGIAEKTNVSITRLLELNPDLDPQSLQAGAKLKLR